MTKGFFDDVANVLNNRPRREGQPEAGDGVALTSCGGPHFAPFKPAVGAIYYCPISETTYVYGQAGWKVSNVTAHPVVVEKEERRVMDGLAKLMSMPAKE